MASPLMVGVIKSSTMKSVLVFQAEDKEVWDYKNPAYGPIELAIGVQLKDHFTINTHSIAFWLKCDQFLLHEICNCAWHNFRKTRLPFLRMRQIHMNLHLNMSRVSPRWFPSKQHHITVACICIAIEICSYSDNYVRVGNLFFAYVFIYWNRSGGGRGKIINI